ncbi:MAG: hypothetical protein LUQ38_05620 [Methanotrichaceae archaeon]|nr:hypothetical protein [Methanotrichaceae archaeon]
MKVDDNWFLGSGIHLSNITVAFDRKEKDQLVAYVNDAQKFAKECQAKVSGSFQ